MKFKRAANENEAKEIMELQFQHDEDFIFLGSFFTKDNINIIYWQQTDYNGDIAKHLSIVKFNCDMSLLKLPGEIIDEIANSFIGDKYELKCKEHNIYVVKEVKHFVC